MRYRGGYSTVEVLVMVKDTFEVFDGAKAPLCIWSPTHRMRGGATLAWGEEATPPPLMCVVDDSAFRHGVRIYSLDVCMVLGSLSFAGSSPSYHPSYKHCLPFMAWQW